MFLNPSRLRYSSSSLVAPPLRDGILREFREPWLFAERLIGLPFDKLKSLHLPPGHPGVEDNFQTNRGEVDVQGFNQRI